MSEITKEKLIELFGDVKVKFSSYYKYTFYYKGVKDSALINVSIGGDGDEIYRHSVVADKEFTIRELDPDYADICSQETGETIYTYYE